jgi:hypothetical protein
VDFFIRKNLRADIDQLTSPVMKIGTHISTRPGQEDWFTDLVIVLAEICESQLILMAFSVTIMYVSKAGESIPPRALFYFKIY